ncbi:hypothetical protein SELMODRAFT_423424 [Selaginella moellendorffii]|uniref:Beta-hexosaminidase n=1 Tax=Selaginella moellendorffii TaxID=88036 RepID=D8SLN7_SELML|nr:beta-hexosaminidase 2 [Selaginella moellendorffii]EFJ14804.1 hypothetical protein SELMODRAFT_423424 [Selaginella moellendorffii]|eukprot:XP_002984294.1 beta-hexosaminidase 2 [Selaginella moellendorffii]
MEMRRLFGFLIFWSVQVCRGSELFLWPQPQIVEAIDKSCHLISPTFTISVPAGSPKLLRAAASRYKRQVCTEKWSAVSIQARISSQSAQATISRLVISVSDLRAGLQNGVDESYTLVVSEGDSASIVSNTTWGALHGLETFSQLVQFDSQARKLFISYGVRITDWPLYSHRGLLLDTSRNFFPVKDILRTIQALSYNKLNVFHWHISDSHSFPLRLESEPELSKKGSYGPEFTYSRQDVKRIVAFARSRGVRVVPEIDAPGHTASWGAAYPEMLTCLGKMWWDPNTQNWSKRMASEPGAGQLNPLHPKTYQVLKHIIEEVTALFPDSFYHAGADEIAPGCWNASEELSRLVSSGNATMGSLLELFVNRTYPMIASRNKTVVYWEDILLDAAVNVSADLLPRESTVIQTWNNGAINTKAVTSAGYRAVVSSSDFLYLDCGRGDFLFNDSRFDQPNRTVVPPSLSITGDDASFNYGGSGGSWCAPYKTWQRIYDFDLAYGLTRQEAALVIGAEAALWSELADANVLDGLVWPRTSALAEVTWSGNRDSSSKKRTTEAGKRLVEWRERMVSRGVAAHPMMPRWCILNHGLCNINI